MRPANNTSLPVPTALIPKNTNTQPHRCLHVRYAGTKLTMAELRESCPLCRGCCTCKACLSNPRHNGTHQIIMTQ